MPTLLVFGYGYSAAALGRRLRAAGWEVRGTVRDPARGAALAAQGVVPLPFPLADEAAAFDGVTHVLASAPPGASGDPVLAAHGPALAARAGRLAWAGYLSTTGVYGDHGGGWVDEETPRAPASGRGLRRMAAEDAWFALGLPLAIFRLAGIYGPGRNALEGLLAGTQRAIVKPGQVFSRIHVDDIAAALAASIARPRPGAAYNVADDLPAPPHEVVEFAAGLLGLPAPPREDFDAAQGTMSEMARSFYSESKRVSNARLKRELAVTLAYPSYREGLRALLPAVMARKAAPS